MKTLLALALSLVFALALATPAVAQQTTIAGLWTADLPEGLASIDIPVVISGEFAGTHSTRDMADGALDVAPLEGRVEGQTVTLTVTPESGRPVLYEFRWDGADMLVGTDSVFTYTRAPRGRTAGLAK